MIDDDIGDAVDLDLSGSKGRCERALRQVCRDTGARKQPDSRSRGQPKLGVVSKEVTLLPRHWEWLALQRWRIGCAASSSMRRANRVAI